MKALYVFYAHDSKLRGIGRLSCRCDQTPSLSPCDAATKLFMQPHETPHQQQ